MGKSSHKSVGSRGEPNLTQSYNLYAALLAVKLLSFIPLGYCSKLGSERLACANLSDLRHLTPFWLLAALYITTSPDPDLALNLLRTFVAARFIAAAGYVFRIPICATKAAFFVSFTITAFMGASVLYRYQNAL